MNNIFTKKLKFIFGVMSYLIGIQICFSQSHNLAKENSYHFFNPTSKSQMRQMNTDRPDVTETPNTVDAGHFQFEFEISIVTLFH